MTNPADSQTAVREAILKCAKRSFDVFVEDKAAEPTPCLDSQRVKVASKLMNEYASVKDLPSETSKGSGTTGSAGGKQKKGDSEDTGETGEALNSLDQNTANRIPRSNGNAADGALMIHPGGAQNTLAKSTSATPGVGSTLALAAKRQPAKVPKPAWHAPWRLKAVVSGHLGWVRAIAFDPGNRWFCTGAADRCLKIWDLAKCAVGADDGLMLTLTGHISCIRGLAVSARSPYLFSCAEDKMVNCWDLEQNKVVRHYHGHLSGVYALTLHPSLDLLVTAGRDSVARVWDIRSARSVFVLSGHQNTVGSVICNPVDPQVVTGSHDCMIRLWDLTAGKTMATLTNHKKAVRSLTKHPREFSFISAGADNLKKWQTRDGKFIRNLSGHNTIINATAVNDDGVLVSGGDNGSLHFWDYQTGYNFQQIDTIVQPGSLDAEAGIYAMSFDQTGTRLVTCEADKTLKLWAEDTAASEESHPVDMKGWTKACRTFKRY